MSQRFLVTPAAGDAGPRVEEGGSQRPIPSPRWAPDPGLDPAAAPEPPSEDPLPILRYCREPGRYARKGRRGLARKIWEALGARPCGDQSRVLLTTHYTPDPRSRRGGEGEGRGPRAKSASSGLRRALPRIMECPASLGHTEATRPGPWLGLKAHGPEDRCP
ncbi:hypothetical protein H8959_014142 [Pygathrix nigripes]